MKLKRLTFALMSAIALMANAQNAVQTVEQVTGTITLNDAVDYTITSSKTPFATGASIDIQNPDATVVFENIRPSVVISKYLGKITANGTKLTNGTNARVSIYRHGAIVFAHSDTKNADGSDFYPVVMCSDDNCRTVIGNYNNTGRNTSGPWKDAARSFILKRGYMCTVANEADGTGYSHCYIANSADRKITLNKYLAGRLGFFRIFQWQWPTKLGMSDARAENILVGTNASWFYDWGAGRSSQIDFEYVPQRHHEAGESNGDGYKGAWESWDNINASDNTCTHILGQNEPDNTGGGKEVYTYVKTIPNPGEEGYREKHGNYPLIDVAKEFLYSGKRIGTFACCNPNTEWVSQYVNWCRENNIRVDFVATHYYIGGQSPQGCIDRLWALYNATGLPVWVTEWNNGANWTNEGGFSTDSEGRYSWGSGNDQQKNGVWLKDVLVRADKPENKWLERLAVYNAVEYKRQIEANGSLTDAGRVLGTYHSGFAYNDANEYFMPWTYKEPTELTSAYSAASKKVTLTWKHNNSKQSTSIRVQRKTETRYSTVEDIGMHGNGTLTFTDDVSDITGAISYRICDIDTDDGIRYSNEVIVDVAPSQGNENFQYGTSTISSNDAVDIKFGTTLNAPKITDICMFMGSLTNQNPTFNAGNYAVTDTRDHLTYQFVPWTNNTGSIRSVEELPFLALPKGIYKYGDLDCEVGSIASEKASTNPWTDVTEVTFQQPFPEGVTPVVLTEIRKPTSSTIAYCTRVYDITNTGFKFIIYPDEAASAKVGRSQTVCYMAITPGIGMLDEENGIMIAAGTGTDEDIYGNTTCSNNMYVPTYDEATQSTKMERLRLYQPCILTALQTNNYPAMCMLRRANITEKENGIRWTTGFRLTRLLDRNLTIEDKQIPWYTTEETYRDKVGWVAIATYKEGGSVPTAIEGLSADTMTDSQKPRIIDGRVYVDGATSFKIYSVTGSPVPTDNRLVPGIYVIYVNGKSYKTLVK